MIKADNSTKSRISSIELLRIFCMALIILHHYVVHTEFDIEKLNFNVYVLQIISMGGKFACNIFILITGYFMITSKVNYKKIILLIGEMLFYSILFMMIGIVSGITKFNIKNFIKAIFPIFWGNWFIIFYIMLYMLIPYINKLIEQLDEITFKKLLLTLFIILSIVPTFTAEAWRFSNIDIFIFMYMLGAYIRLYHDNKLSIKTKIISIISIILLFLSPIFIDFISEILHANKLLSKATYFSTQNSFLCIVASVSMFLIFKNIELKSNFINWISSSVLGVYLISDNRTISYWLWNELSPNATYLNSNFLITHVIVKVFFIFVVCTAIDKTRIILFEKHFKNIIYQIFEKLKVKIKLDSIK